MTMTEAANNGEPECIHLAQAVEFLKSIGVQINGALICRHVHRAGCNDINPPVPNWVSVGSRGACGQCGNCAHCLGEE